MRFGETLKRERERHGIALDDIAVATRVSLRNLHALEDERFLDLPGGVFNRGIVRSYARFCGMDEDTTVSAYADAVREHGLNPETGEDNWVTFAENVRRNRIRLNPERHIRWAGVAAMCAGVLFLAAAVFALLAYRGIVSVPPRLQSLLHHGQHVAPPSPAPRDARRSPDPATPPPHPGPDAPSGTPSDTP